jgi:hypothetical protein
MQTHGIEMIVLVKNKPIHEYQYNDQFFIEGRSNSNYEIELRNHTNGRVQTVLSVDGLSVIDGQEAGPQSRSYVIDAHGTLRVPGWLLDGSNAAKFAFASRPDSYASQISDGKTRNVGVIGVLVYTEKVAPITYPSYPVTYPFTTWNGISVAPNPFYQNTSINNMWDSFIIPRGIACSANSATAAPLIGASFSNNAVPKSRGSSAGEQKTSGGIIGDAAPPVQQSLGTAFGDQTQFATRSVAFDRGAQLTVMSLYYDSLKGLRAKGVPIERRGKSQRPPEAFPGMSGCRPPVGWNR